MRAHLKAAFIVFLVGMVGVYLYVRFMNARVSDGSTTPLATIEKMEQEGVPNFKFKNLKGEAMDLQSLQGKVIILNFWASWCSPCVEEVPSLIKLAKEFKNDVVLIAVSGDSSKEDIDVFLKSFPEMQGESRHVVFDEDKSIMKTFDISRLPESMVLDRNHKLAKKLVGSIDWYTPDSIAYMKTLISK